MEGKNGSMRVACIESITGLGLRNMRTLQPRNSISKSVRKSPVCAQKFVHKKLHHGVSKWC